MIPKSKEAIIFVMLMVLPTILLNLLFNSFYGSAYGFGFIAHQYFSLYRHRRFKDTIISKMVDDIVTAASLKIKELYPECVIQMTGDEIKIIKEK
jgi:hypothetical protein